MDCVRVALDLNHFNHYLYAFTQIHKKKKVLYKMCSRPELNAYNPNSSEVGTLCKTWIKLNTSFAKPS